MLYSAEFTTSYENLQRKYLAPWRPMQIQLQCCLNSYSSKLLSEHQIDGLRKLRQRADFKLINRACENKFLNS